MGARDDARSLIHEIVAAYNARDLDSLIARYHRDITYWSALGGLQEGITAVRDHLEHLHQTLPDERMRALAVITDGDLVVAEFESTGTSPLGRPYRIEFTEVFELRDGKVASIRVYLDPEAVAAALG